MTDKPLNATAATKLFSGVYVIGMTCSMNVFDFMITERHYNAKNKLEVSTCKFW